MAYALRRRNFLIKQACTIYMASQFFNRVPGICTTIFLLDAVRFAVA